MKTIEGKNIYTVSEVNSFARQTLELMTFWIEGEISRCDQSKGYNFFYLTLKDEGAILPCIADGIVLQSLEGDPVGQRVLVYGFLSLYEPRGHYQFKIQRIEAVGEGLLRKKLEESIQRLRAEGLFDQKYKKAIPLYPKRVCVVTSYGSDAWNDFKKHTAEKFPIIEIFVGDVRVQGWQSINQLLTILPKVDRLNFDVIVVTRGGGSLEDLAAFNDEGVARTIFKMKTPTIVAIGHETNESLAEWVASRRASTPTDAANVITTGYSDLLEKLEAQKQKLKSTATYFFSTNFQRLDYIYYHLQQIRRTFKDLPHKLNTFRELLKRHKKYLVSDAISKNDEIFRLFKKSTKLLIGNYGRRLKNIQNSLVLLSPQNTLKRGYSITTDSHGRLLKNIKSIVVGSTIGVILVDGRLTSTVRSRHKDGKGRWSTKFFEGPKTS